MCMKNSNRTVTFSRMMVFDVQGRLVEFSARPIPNGLAAIAQKPVTGLVENECLSKQKLHNSVFIPGLEERIHEANLLPAFTPDKSRQNRFCISVSQNKQAITFKHLRRPLSKTIPPFG